jgi:hypothetical protein
MRYECLKAGLSVGIWWASEMASDWRTRGKFMVFQNPAANAELVRSLHATLHVYRAILFMLVLKFGHKAAQTA